MAGTLTLSDFALPLAGVGVEYLCAPAECISQLLNELEMRFENITVATSTDSKQLQIYSFRNDKN